MKIRIIIFILLLLTFKVCYSQPRCITVSTSPTGISNLNILSDNGITIKNIKGFQIGYEHWSDEKDKFLWELSYFYCTLDKNDYDFYTEFKNYTDIDLSLSLGKTLNWGRRLQFPLYCGIGLGVGIGGPIGSLYAHIPIKVRMQYYLTNRLGIYVGSTFRLGLGIPFSLDDEDDEDVFLLPSLNYRLSADVGLIFCF